MKFHLSFLWILFLILAYFSKSIQVYLFIFFLLFVHEMGHILVAKYLKYETSDVYITPFGFCAKIKLIEYMPSYHLLIVMIGGLGMHLFFYYLIYFFLFNDFISISYYDYLQSINFSILYFNLLPIYPLDGSRCLFGILNCIFSYKVCKIIIYFISILLIIWLLLFVTFSFKIVLLFLLYINIKDILNFRLNEIEERYYKEKYFKVSKNHV